MAAWRACEKTGCINHTVSGVHNAKHGDKNQKCPPPLPMAPLTLGMKKHPPPPVSMAPLLGTKNFGPPKGFFVEESHVLACFVAARRCQLDIQD